MLRKLIGHLLVLLISIGVGVLAGQQFYQLFLRTVPGGWRAEFTDTTMHASCILYGVGLGVVMFVWVIAGGAILKVAAFATKKRGPAPTKP